MEHSTKAVTLPSLAALLAGVSDRRKPKGLRYPLPPLLVLLSLAKFCGQDRPAAIAEWVSHRGALWREKLELRWKRMPSASTWQRLLGQQVAAAELDERVAAYFRALSAAERQLYNLDGKVLSGTAEGESGPLHLLALQEAATQAVVAQTALLPGENEISAAKRLLGAAELTGKVVSGDAIFAQQELSRLVVERGGEYLWKLRANQGRLYRAAAAHFAAASAEHWERATSVEKGHGRLEEREVVTSFRLAARLEFPHLAQVFRLHRRSEEMKSGKVSEQTIYGLTSWPVEQAGARELLAAARGHWGIENGLHRRRDVTFHEDACRHTKHNAGRVQAAFNNLTIGVCRRLGWDNLAQARRYFEAHLDEALKLILTPLPLLL